MIKIVRQDIVTLLVQGGGGGIAAGNSDSQAKTVRYSVLSLRSAHDEFKGWIHHAGRHLLTARYFQSQI